MMAPNRTIAAADHVNRAKAISTTVWFALGTSQAMDEVDLSDLRDTLYEAIIKLSEAEKELGMYHDAP